MRLCAHPPLGLLAVFVLAVAAVALPTRPASATIVLETTLEDMTRVSALVVRGEVTAVTSRAEGESRTRLVTDVTLRLDEVLKGSREPGEFTFTVPGGQSDEYVMAIPGMPRFRVGQEVVLFLEPTASGFVPSGLQQGRFSVLREPVTGRTVALRTFDEGIALARRKADGTLDISHVEDRSDLLYLDDLRHEVRRTVERFGQLPELPTPGGQFPNAPSRPLDRHIDRPAPAAPAAP
jgi:hypothetical protein